MIKGWRQALKCSTLKERAVETKPTTVHCPRKLIAQDVRSAADRGVSLELGFCPLVTLEVVALSTMLSPLSAGVWVSVLQTATEQLAIHAFRETHHNNCRPPVYARNTHLPKNVPRDTTPSMRLCLVGFFRLSHLFSWRWFVFACLFLCCVISWRSRLLLAFPGGRVEREEDIFGRRLLRKPRHQEHHLGEAGGPANHRCFSARYPFPWGPTSLGQKRNLEGLQEQHP